MKAAGACGLAEARRFCNTGPRDGSHAAYCRAVQLERDSFKGPFCGFYKGFYKVQGLGIGFRVPMLSGPI